MSRGLEVDRCRLKRNQKLYSETKIATSMDVAFLFSERVKNRQGDAIWFLNLNSSGQIIKFYAVDKETFTEEKEELLASAILSNAANCILVSNIEANDEMVALTNEYAKALKFLEVPLLDHISIAKEGMTFVSYRNKGYLDRDVTRSDIARMTEKQKKPFEISRLDEDAVRIDLQTDRFLGSEMPENKDAAIDLIADEIAYSDREEVWVLALDETDKPKSAHTVAQGSVQETLAPRSNILKAALMAEASKIVVLHNHPSGSVKPSDRDLELAQHVKIAGQLLGIELAENVIVGGLNKEIYRYNVSVQGERLEPEAVGSVRERMPEKGGNEMRRLFVDLDGTLAVFTPVEEMETLYEPGYFESLRPHFSVVDGVRRYIQQNPEADVYVLSAVLADSPYALDEKNRWLDRMLPEIDKEHRIFPPCGADKAAFVPGGIGRNDILFDDYTNNLFAWEQQGGAGVKLRNAINGTKGRWQGAFISYDSKPDVLCAQLEAACRREMRAERERRAPMGRVDLSREMELE